ncbi:PAS domain S-box protein [Shewanella waksmanii]|uniref:PAS domain S-box protein n=1 Tax=Shewanella waksmanii TaxID=213783 RepID=UPI003736E011
MSFRLKTVLGIALIEGALLMLLVYTSINYLKQANETEVERRAHVIGELFAVATKDAVISSDISTLQELSQELIDKTGVQQVKVYDRHNLLYQSNTPKQNLTETTEDKLQDRVLHVSAQVSEGDYHFGRVELTLTSSGFGAFIDDARQHILSIAALEMGLVALFSWLLGMYLTRNLRTLKKAANRILAGEKGVTVPVHNRDEIGQVAHVFNEMVQTVDANQTALENANIQLTTILGTAIDGFVIINTDGVITEANQALLQRFGYQESELIGKRASMLTPSVSRLESEHSLQQFIASSRQRLSVKPQEVIAQTKRGAQFPIQLTISKMVINGQTCLLGLVKDLTEVKKSEQAAQRVESILLATLEASHDALITIDITGKIEQFNDAASMLFGYAPKKAIGELMGDLLFCDGVRAEFNQGLQEYRLTGDGPAIKKNVMLTAKRSNGSTLPIELRMVPVQLGDEVLLTAYLHDVSSRIEYQQQLTTAKELAEAGSLAKSRFLATMSHEIRSPLNAVLGSVDLMLESSLNQEQRIYANTAKEAGTALLSTINDILDFSKIEAGQMSLQVQAFSPADVVAQVLQILAPKAHIKAVQLGSFINRNVPDSLVGDQQKLRQVLHNLVDNAIKFSDSGCISVEMWIPDSHVEECELFCSVTDQGIGVSQAAQSKLFKEFSQVHDTHSTNYAGTGLGLAICNELVSLMGGEITLTSQLGHGACFRFNVAMRRNPDTTNIPYQVPAHCRVLLVHPNETYSQLVRKQYNQYGVQTQLISSLKEVVEGDLIRGRFNLILIDDSCLVDLSSQAVELLKRDFLFDDGLLAVMLSALASQQIEHLKAIEVAQFVNKPLSREILLGLLSAEGPLATANNESLEKVLTPSDQGVRLLLAEDSPSNQIVAGAMLTKMGYEVDYANNGIEAVEMAAQRPYGLILMDMRMPRMDGLQAAQQILLTQPQSVIIAMTANVQQEDKDQCFDAGMKDFVAKPVNRIQMLTTVQKWLAMDATPELDEADSDSEPKAARLESIQDVNRETEQAKSMTENQDLIDGQVISELESVLGADSLHEMMTVFIAETEQRLLDIKNLMTTEDNRAIADEAHTLKSSAGSFGALPLFESAKQLEHMAQSTAVAQMQSQIEHTLTLGVKTCKQLKQKFAQ